jgi:hypothetical protein
MHPACSIKPNPIVMIFSMSLSTTARKNNSTRPPHRNRIMSKPGVLSLNPVIKAKKVGKVAQCNTIAANQPRVSAESVAKLLLRNSRMATIVTGNLKGMITLRRKCDDQFYQFWAVSSPD